MANAKQQENLLLTEHFTWPPISLIDDIINAVNEVLYRCTDSFETGLSAADPALLGFSERYAVENRVPEKDEDGTDVFPEAKLEIEEGVLKLETLMENAVDKNFDKLEIWTLRNVLCLPRGEEELASWVRLEGYENLEAPPKNPTVTPEALYTLRRKLIETQKLNAALVAEKNRNDTQLARLRSFLQPAVPKRETRTSTSHPTQSTTAPAPAPAPFAFLTHTPAAQSLGIQPLPQPSSAPSTGPESRTPITTHTRFTTSQLPHLRHLLDTLRPHLAAAALPTNTNSRADEKEELTRERERKVYVESQSKRILEKRGVDTRDGVEGVWDGSRVGSEEVRGLEGLVDGLKRGRRRGGEMDKGGDVDMDEHVGGGTVREDGGAGDGDGDGDGEAMDTS